MEKVPNSRCTVLPPFTKTTLETTGEVIANWFFKAQITGAGNRWKRTEKWSWRNTCKWHMQWCRYDFVSKTLFDSDSLLASKPQTSNIIICDQNKQKGGFLKFKQKIAVWWENTKHVQMFGETPFSATKCCSNYLTNMVQVPQFLGLVNTC